MIKCQLALKINSCACDFFFTQIVFYWSIHFCVLIHNLYKSLQEEHYAVSHEWQGFIILVFGFLPWKQVGCVFLLIIVNWENNILSRESLVLVVEDKVATIYVFLQFKSAQYFLRINVIDQLFLFRPDCLQHILNVHLVICPFRHLLHIHHFLVVLADKVAQSPEVKTSSATTLTIKQTLHCSLLHTIRLINNHQRILYVLPVRMRAFTHQLWRCRGMQLWSCQHDNLALVE